jgi:hypothetical protein
MTLPASNPTLGSLLHYVQTAVPTTAYTIPTPSPVPTSWDLQGYLENPPAPSIPSWVKDIPDSGSQSAFSELIVSLESASVSLGRLATAGWINGTYYAGIVPKTAAVSGGVVSQIGDGQVQAPTGVASISAAATMTTKAVVTSTVVVVSSSVGASSSASAAASAAATTVASYTGGAESIGVSVVGMALVGMAGVAALL